MDNSELWQLLFQTVERIRILHDLTTGENLQPGRPDITISQIRVLVCVFSSNTGKVKVKDIARELGITSGGVSQIVDNLVKYGLLERCLDENDRRAVSITLSEKGLKIHAKLNASYRILFDSLMEAVSPEKREVFKEVLVTLLAEVEHRRLNEGK